MVHQDIIFNKIAHDRVAGNYEARHGEIFNSLEQARLREALKLALEQITTGEPVPHVLDYGAGSGNLTSHLLALRARVTAADLSSKFLKLINSKFNYNSQAAAVLVNGADLRNFASNSFDMVATYSVLHHVPDYLKIIREMMRVLKPGGVLYIDHEALEQIWHPPAEYREFVDKITATMPYDWSKWLEPKRYLSRFYKILNPRYQAEGDIHVFADDHIEWDKIRAAVAESGGNVISETDYLLFKRGYDQKVYEEYASKTADTKSLLARKLE
ncbi:MAG: methyltransferase domain-containing protein [Candidatus Magasanikbacteria bacterium]|nr:methyltransferase domain-containing protein [Candidatus Magasanikbacteria bacterium]